MSMKDGILYIGTLFSHAHQILRQKQHIQGHGAESLAIAWKSTRLRLQGPLMHGISPE